MPQREILMQTNAPRLIALTCMAIELALGFVILFIQITQYIFDLNYTAKHSFIAMIPYFLGTGILFFLPAFGSYRCYKLLVKTPKPSPKRTIIAILPIFFLFFSLSISFLILWIIAQVLRSL